MGVSAGTFPKPRRQSLQSATRAASDWIERCMPGAAGPSKCFVEVVVFGAGSGGGWDRNRS